MKRVVLATLACVMLCTVWAAAAEADEPRGWLGIRMATKTALQLALSREEMPEQFMAIPMPEDLLEAWDRPGVLVVEVIRETPAEIAGVFPGDVITELNGIRVDSPGTLAWLMRRAIPARDAALGVLRDGEVRELLFVVGEREQEKKPEKDSEEKPTSSSPRRP